jgi:hypothetical protein
MIQLAQRVAPSGGAILFYGTKSLEKAETCGDSPWIETAMEHANIKTMSLRRAVAVLTLASVFQYSRPLIHRCSSKEPLFAELFPLS